MDRAELIHDDGDSGINALLGGYVGLAEDGAPLTELRNSLSAGFGIQVEEGNLCTLLVHHVASSGLPQARSTAGDYYNFIFQVHKKPPNFLYSAECI